MKLPRVDQDTRKPSLINQIQKISAEQKYQQDELVSLLTNPDEFIARLDELWYQTLMMKQEELQDAEAKYQQTLLLATVHEQHKVLVDFINDMRSEITELKNKQLQLLSEQEQYKKSVHDDVYKSMKDIYYIVEENQKVMFDNVTANAKKSVDDMNKTLTDNITSCRKTTETLKDQLRKSITLEKWTEGLLLMAPFAVIVDMIFRVLTFFMK